jgi:branched-chain amino acid transport system ATP-binding protein
MTAPLLEVRDLELFYGDAQALSGVSFAVPEHSVTAIVGANGAGKTSLIRSIGGILRPASGTIRYRGQQITREPSHVVCNLGIGQVPEGRQIFPTLTVLENLEVGASIRRARTHMKASLAQVFEHFPRLAERRQQRAGTLSGGEQQMLAIGRCLMGRPELVMFDEPSLGLAPAVVRGMFQVIRELAAAGLTIILVEQNVAASLRLADQAHVLETGRIVLSGSGTAVLENPAMQQAYLGL